MELLVRLFRKHVGMPPHAFQIQDSIRYLPFAYADRVTFPAWLNEFFSYVPVAALSAIIAPVIMFHEGELDISTQNIHLLVSLVAGFVAYMTKGMLWTVLSGFLLFLVLKFF
jgi:branched-subunit amino acid transport protein